MNTRINNLETWKISLISLFSIIVVFTIMFWGTLSAIVSIWIGSDTFTHGFFIIPISAYLIWKKRDKLKQLTPSINVWLLLPALGLSFLWVLAYVAEIQLVKQMAAVSILLSMVWFVLGNSVVKTIAFPLGFILFSVPFGEFLVAPLQDLTAAFTVEAVRFSGIPVFWEGRHFVISSGRFEVAAACSGVRFLIVSIVLATLYAYLNYVSYWRRLLFVIILALVSIIANGVRAYGIVMMAHYSDYTIGVGVDHLYYGWIFFGLTLFTAFWLGSYFQQQPNKDITINSEVQTENSSQYSILTVSKWWLMSICIVTSGPLFAKWIDSSEIDPLLAKIQYPILNDEWRGPIEGTFDWQPKYVGATTTDLQEYRKVNDASVLVFVAKYFKQHQGAELINSQNSVYDNSKWKRSHEDFIKVDIHKEQKEYKTMVITSGNKKYLLWYWYQVGSNTSANAMKTKIYELAAKLNKDNHGSKVVILASAFEVDESEAKENIIEFIKKIKLETAL